MVGGCSTEPRREVLFGHKVAVLPLANQSVDLSAPGYVRKVFSEKIGRRGYAPLETSAVDEALRTKLSVNEGGQLEAVTPQKIGEALDVDRVFYGEVLDYKNVNLGVYQQKSVKLKFRLVDAKTGATLWESEKGASAGAAVNGGGDLGRTIGRTFVKGLIEDRAGRLIDSPLREQVDEVMRHMLTTLPPGD